MAISAANPNLPVIADRAINARDLGEF